MKERNWKEINKIIEKYIEKWEKAYLIEDNRNDDEFFDFRNLLLELGETHRGLSYFWTKEDNDDPDIAEFQELYTKARIIIDKWIDYRGRKCHPGKQNYWMQKAKTFNPYDNNEYFQIYMQNKKSKEELNNKGGMTVITTLGNQEQETRLKKIMSCDENGENK